jgi:hypothetical protein
MVSEFGLDLSGLALDMTNFATFIDSTNDRAPIAQRGHAKQKRVDLRLVGLGLVVTRDGAVPVTSHAYAGNRPDVTQFPTLVDELAVRYRDLAGAAPTVVFDAGQNSAANSLTWPRPGCTSSARCPRPSIRTCSPCRPGGAPWSTRTGSAS